MKKGFQLSAAAVLALSAITPVAAAAAENTEVAQGVYTTDSFTSIEAFKKLKSAEKGKLLMTPGAVLVVGTDAIPAELIVTGSDKDIAAGSVDVEKYQKDNNVTFDPEKGIVPGDTVEGNLKVESVSAINLTTVEVTFNNAVDAVAKENFTIEGSTVKSVSLSEDKKTATLSVEKLNYATPYTVVAKNIEVNGEVQPESSKAFTTKAVTDLWELKVSAPETIVADGVDTEIVKFELLDENGEIDKNANDIVLDINSTYGYLSQKRVTIQNGVAQVILRSEFVPDTVTAKIDAQIIEAKAGSEYKDLIGKVFGTETIKFAPAGSDQGGSTVLIKSLVGANTNEADRVVLTFDEEISPADFYSVDAQGNVTDKNAVKVSQVSGANGPALPIAGYLFDENNKKKVTVVLEKTDVLEDNKDVYVTAKIGANGPTVTKTFKLADARTPNFTGVSVVSNKELTVTFSEPISEADFKIDARFAAPGDFDVEFGEIEFVDGRYVDLRNQATITLTNYQEKDVDDAGAFIYPEGFFKPGKHSIEASNIFDFAAETDTNNIGTTQNLEFTIQEDKTAVAVTPIVDSPEQYRVNFDKEVAFVNGNAASTFDKTVQFQVWNAEEVNADGTKGAWVAVDDTYFTNAPVGQDFTVGTLPTNFLTVTTLSNKSYKLETTVDWTKIYDTAATKDNYYNDKFRLVLPKNTVVTAINGKKNAEDIVLPLTTINGKDTALATPDTKSPTISDIERIGTTNQFVVTMTEPVKLHANGDEAGTTLAQNQAALPETKVEFLGKDKDGKVRTYSGKVVKYADDKINDKIIVEWDTPASVPGEFVTPQELVDQKDNTNTTWTVVVKSISDDIGNTVPTATKDFELKKSPVVGPITGEFKVDPTGGTAIGKDGVTNTFKVLGKDGATPTDVETIELTFTEAVAVVGEGSATNVMNYTLNGDKLPTGSTISLGADDKTVIITVKANTLKASNVITLAKHIESKESKVITGDLTFTFDIMTFGQQQQQQADALLAAADLTSLAFTEDTSKNEADNIIALQGLVDALSLNSAITATASVASGKYVVTLTTANATAPRVEEIATVTTTNASVADALLAAADLTSLAFTEDTLKNEADNIIALQGLVAALTLDPAITATASVANAKYVVTLTTANATAPRVEEIATVTTTTP